MSESKIQNFTDLCNDLRNLNIRPKNLKNVVFVGHVDAGKSTICGRILVDLKLIDERILEKYKNDSIESNRTSWYLSWCMDLNSEEREKGKTTEVGTAAFDLPNSRINILDAPGHSMYVHEMIEGASRADIGILIVSARKNEFEAGFKGGQTKEHVRLLKAGNVRELIVLVNKMDEADWDELRFKEIETKILKFTKVLFKEVKIIPISGFLGENILYQNNKHLYSKYYSGESFLEYLDSIKIVQPEVKPALTVIEKVKTTGSTSFYVRAENTNLNNLDVGFKKGIEYKILPINKNDKISIITDEDDVEVEKTIPGETYKIKLTKCIDETSVGYKIVGVDNNDYLGASEFIGELGIYEVNKAVTIGYSAMMHINMQVVGCKIIDLYNLDKKKIKVARKGEKVLAKFILESPIIVVCNKTRKDRFSLRDEALTVACGQIKKIIN